MFGAADKILEALQEIVTLLNSVLLELKGLRSEVKSLKMRG